MKSQKADLHLHTTASDGVINAPELVKLLHDKGLSCISITDHDSISGYLKAKDIAEELNIQLIPGVEITSNYEGRECHILAYGFNTESSDFINLLSDQRKKRVNRADIITGKLNRLGYDIDMDDVTSEAGSGTISRSHIATILLRKKYVATKQEAFDRLLDSKSPAYVQNSYPDVTDVINLVGDAGGVSILAHPGQYYKFEDYRFFLNAGIDGMEFIHPSHTYAMQKKIKDYCENYKLLLSGGSDFHGTRPHEEQYLGTVCVDRQRAELILENCGNPVQTTVS